MINLPLEECWLSSSKHQQLERERVESATQAQQAFDRWHGIREQPPRPPRVPDSHDPQFFHLDTSAAVALPPEECWLSSADRSQLGQAWANQTSLACEEFGRHHERMALMHKARVKRARRNAQRALRRERVEQALQQRAAEMAARVERLRKRAIQAELARLGPLSVGFGVAAHGFPVTWSWLQWIGSQAYLGDFVSMNYQQHIDSQPKQVLFLPFETCSVLLAKDSAHWSIQSVIVNTDGSGSNTPQDGATGLDQIIMNSNTPWGVDSLGRAYFDPAGADGKDVAQLFLDIYGAPYLQT